MKQTPDRPRPAAARRAPVYLYGADREGARRGAGSFSTAGAGAVAC